jgi:hypothetical protein
MSENSINENEYTASAENKSASETPAAVEEAAATEQTTSAAEDEKFGEAAPAEAAAATTAVVKIEGQEFPLDVRVAEKDELLKAALSPHYPSIKNAQITRETRAGQMIVSIVKRAEHKGSDGRRRTA